MINPDSATLVRLASTYTLVGDSMQLRKQTL